MSEKDVVLEMDGDAHFAHRKDFINLQESPAGFGDTKEEAIANLIEDEERNPDGNN